MHKLIPFSFFLTAGQGAAPGAAAGSACVVPKVVGLKLRAARRRLARAGCTARLRGRGRRIARQNRKAGRRLPAGAVVRLRRGA